MSEWKCKLPEFMKKISTKWLIIAGIAGILLIYLSSFFPLSNDAGREKATESAAVSGAEYCERLEKKVKSIVTSITGEKNPTVVITLETGIQYLYADDEKNKTASSAETASGTERKKAENETQADHVILKDANGDERAVIVTEYMPAVRGVAVVCNGGGSETVREKIVGAITAALDISARKIYVTGTN